MSKRGVVQHEWTGDSVQGCGAALMDWGHYMGVVSMDHVIVLCIAVEISSG